MSIWIIIGIIFGAFGFGIFIWLLIKFLILCLDAKENRNTLAQIKNWCAEAQKTIEEIKDRLDELTQED